MSVSIWRPPYRALSAGLVLSILLIAFESLAVATVLPSVARDLRGLALYGWAFSAFFVGYLLSTVTLGALADERGPGRPFVVALALFTAGLLAAGLAPSMPVLIAGRALQGLGGGGLVAITYVVIGRAFPDELRARMLALISSAWVLPALIGPFAASLVERLSSWRLVFLGLVPLALLALPLTLPALRRLGAAGTRLDPARVRAAGLAALGVTLALAALQQREAWRFAALLLAGGALGVPALRALFPPGQWRLAGPLEAGFATRFALTLSFFGAEAFVPLGLQEAKSLTPLQAGLVLTASALTWSSASMLHSRFDERTGGRHRAAVARVGAGLVALAILLTGIVILSPDLPVGIVWGSWALGGLGMALGFQSHTLVVLAHSPGGQEGQVSGTLQTADVLGSAIGAGIGGALVATLGLRAGLTGLFALTVAVVLLLGQVATARLGRAAGKRAANPAD